MGALYLLAARKASSKLFDSPATLPNLAIFPEHAGIVREYLGSDSITTIGTEPEVMIDAVLCLGMIACNDDNVSTPQDDEQFNEYLQRLSLLSANSSSPTLRYHAHTLTSSVLHSHPSGSLRLSFILDTLEHCPYENLKASAVGWLKAEILTANTQAPEGIPDNPSVFSTPVAIDTTAPYLFPDVTDILQQPPPSDSWTAFQINFSFYLASLNFYYLLLSSPHIRQNLDIVNIHAKHKVSQRFLTPLRQYSKQCHQRLEQGQLAGEEDQTDDFGSLSDLQILDHALQRVSETLAALGLQSGLEKLAE